MKKLIIVADDFGLCHAVNEGIIKTYFEGITTELSLFVTTLGTKEAIEFSKKHPTIPIGLHLVLGQEPIDITKNYSLKDITILRPKSVKWLLEYLEKASKKEIENYIKKQFAFFSEKLGRKPSHIIPHQGIHGDIKVLETVTKISKQENIPMRLPYAAFSEDFSNYFAETYARRSHITMPSKLFEAIQEESPEQVIKKFEIDLSTSSNSFNEILTHPGFYDREVRALTSLSWQRVRDLIVTLDPDFRNFIKKSDFKLVDFAGREKSL